MKTKVTVQRKADTMEDVIKKLVDLAEDYADKAIMAGYPVGHNYLRKGVNFSEEEGRITVYLNNQNTTKSVYLGEVEIALYSNNIVFPFSFDAMKLTEIYDDAKEFLDNFKDAQLEEVKKKNMEEREKKIEMLEKELNHLKGIES